MLKTLAAIGVTQALAIAINFLRTRLVAVLLGPSGVGVVSIIDQVVQLAAYLSAFNIPLAALKMLSQAHSRGEDEFRRGYASFLKAALILAGAGTLVTVGLVALRPQLLWALAPGYHLPGIAAGFIAAAAATFVLALLRLRSRHALKTPAEAWALMLYSLAAVLPAGAAGARPRDPGWPVALKLGLYLCFAAGLLPFLSRGERASLSGLKAWLRP